MKETNFIVVGAGPAGMLIAELLGQIGYRVVVLEKAASFERSFRGESISPDSVSVLRILGIFDYLNPNRMQAVHGITITDGGSQVLAIDFESLMPGRELPTEIPQDNLLSAIRASGAHNNLVDVRFNAKVIGLLIGNDGRVEGVRYQSPSGEQTISGDLVIGADGRYSNVRDLSGISFEKEMLARDFLWMKVTSPPSWDSSRYHVRIADSHHVMCIPTVPNMVRLGVNIPQGEIRKVRNQGFDAFLDRVAAAVPELEEPLRGEVLSWRDTSVLDIFTTTADRWSRPGLVLIGDAAHTMTPVLAQGVNNAILDALVLADQLDVSSKDGTVSDKDRKTQTDEAAQRFSDLRRPQVEASRLIQLRQERLFAMEGARAFARRLLYRAVHIAPMLQRRIWSGVYYGLEKRGNPTTAALECRKNRINQ